jgi:tetratricopeptide (TPR) repeat protein
LNAALDFYRELPKTDSADPEVQAELAAAYFRMGVIENDNGSSNWLPEIQRGLEITERLIALKTPIEKFKSFDAGIARPGAGTVFKMDAQLMRQLPEATKTLERMVRVWEKLVSLHPHSIGMRTDLATQSHVLGHLKSYAGLMDSKSRPQSMREALASYSRSLEIGRALVREYPANPRFRGNLPDEYISIGTVYFHQGNYSEAQAALREAVALSQTLVREYPQVPRYRVDLATGYRNLMGLYGSMKNVRGAVDALRQELAVREKLLADFPTVTAYKMDLNQTYRNAVAMSHLAMSQLLSFRTSFFLVLDLYAEVKEKQNDLTPPGSRGRRVSIVAFASLAGFPTANRYLDSNVLARLKQLFDKSPNDVRVQLIDTCLERGKDAKRPGAKTYRLAAADLRWWAGEKEAAVKLLQSYAKETPIDPAIAWALAHACRAMPKDAGPRAPKPAEVLDVLFESLKNPTISRADAGTIIRSIRWLDSDGTLAAPRWDQLLKHEEPSVRRIAFRGLPDNASQLKRFAPVIQQSLADADAGVRVAAACRAWELDRKTEKILPVLTDCLRDPSTENRISALGGLAAMGPRAKAAIPTLRLLIEDPAVDVRQAAQRALQQIDEEATSSRAR